MGLIPYRNVGSRGINFDLRANQLAPEEWTDARNVRFDNNRVIKDNAFRYVGETTPGLAPAVTPHFISLFRNPTEAFWLFAGLAAVYGFADTNDPAAPTDLTRVSGAYTTAVRDRWQSCMFNGVGILNNGRDAPQVWSPIALATPLIDLTNWPASYTARVIRPYLNFLVALDVTKSSGTRYPILVKWSHSADPGTIPTSWDETDPTNDAGEQILADGPYTLIDAEPLGGSLLLYTEQTTWAMTFIGGVYKFSFQKVFAQLGLMAQGCAVAFGNKHFVVTRDDVVVHDGHNFESVADKRVRKYLYDTIPAVAVDRTSNPVIDADAKLNVFVTPQYTRSEMWLSFPISGESIIRQALVWNWKFNTWTYREIPACYFAHSELPVPSSAGDTWDEDTSTTWDGESTLIWDDPSFVRFREKFYLARAEPTAAILEYNREVFTDQDEEAYRSYVERRGLIPIGLNRDGSLAESRSGIKFIKGLWLTINGSPGITIEVYIAAYDVPDAEPTFSGPYNYVVGTTDYIETYQTGRFFALRIEETDVNYWELIEYQLDIIPISER